MGLWALGLHHSQYSVLAVHRGEQWQSLMQDNQSKVEPKKLNAGAHLPLHRLVVGVKRIQCSTSSSHRRNCNIKKIFVIPPGAKRDESLGGQMQGRSMARRESTMAAMAIEYRAMECQWSDYQLVQQVVFFSPILKFPLNFLCCSLLGELSVPFRVHSNCCPGNDLDSPAIINWKWTGAEEFFKTIYPEHDTMTSSSLVFPGNLGVESASIVFRQPNQFN